ncbi:MAG TPA: metallophosphoesterase [Terriglobales bacterium]|nr:metallophosphoesterase [Terriglobales bacterium]
MSQIDEKYQKLKANGLDLGAAEGPEEDAGFGGRVRRYQHGRIYWHASTGAHEVHGGILGVYLEHGGPGPFPATGERHLGFPVSDEEVIPGTTIPISRFEWGAIYWVPATRGCAVYGSMYDPRRNVLGLPVTSNMQIAGGTACFFERGVRFFPRSVPGVDQVIEGSFDPPLMGRAYIMNPGDQNSRRIPGLVRFREMKKQTYEALTAWRGSVFTDLLKGMFSLAPCDAPFSLLPVTPVSVHTAGTPYLFDVNVIMEVTAGQPADVKERTLYDLVLNMPNGMPYPLSPHSIYVKSSWEKFGLLHITDLHVCRRNEGFRARLQQLGLADAAANYANFQDNFKSFVHYANILHAKGLADAVVATGDLVDYGYEEQDDKTVGNYGRLRRLILGQPFEGGEAAEMLKIPIFMTFGNHDYRVNPYDLRSNIDLPGSGNDRGLNEHSTHNLIESEAIALQDGKTPTYTLGNIEGAGKMLEYDRFDNKYNYFKKYMTADRSYVVRLGPHRLVVMDTKYDNGIPDDFDIWTLLNVGFGGSGFFESQVGYGAPATRKLLAGGAPDSAGFSPAELNMLRNAVHDAGTEGIVIVGMHAPAIGPKGGYPYYLRETMHPFNDPALVDQHLAQNKLNGATWTRTGTPHFKAGTAADGLDNGVIASGQQEFLEICSGKGLVRPVDLVLMGHHHDRVEWRVKLDAGSGALQFFTDFYTENPAAYYHTRNNAPRQGLEPGAAIKVTIVPDAPPTGKFKVVNDHTAEPTKKYGAIQTPPYAAPLNSAANPKEWWQERRPILAQTSALGPIDPRQRFGRFFRITPPKPPYRETVEGTEAPQVPHGQGSVEEVSAPVIQPSFQGFRLIQVRDNAIARVRYVVLSELRRLNFAMPWESEGQGLHGGTHGPLGGVVVDRTIAAGGGD